MFYLIIFIIYITLFSTFGYLFFLSRKKPSKSSVTQYINEIISESIPKTPNDIDNSFLNTSSPTNIINTSPPLNIPILNILPVNNTTTNDESTNNEDLLLGFDEDGYLIKKTNTIEGFTGIVNINSSWLNNVKSQTPSYCDDHPDICNTPNNVNLLWYYRPDKISNLNKIGNVINDEYNKICLYDYEKNKYDLPCTFIDLSTVTEIDLLQSLNNITDTIYSLPEGAPCNDDLINQEVNLLKDGYNTTYKHACFNEGTFLSILASFQLIFDLNSFEKVENEQFDITYYTKSFFKKTKINIQLIPITYIILVVAIFRRKNKLSKPLYVSFANLSLLKYKNTENIEIDEEYDTSVDEEYEE